MSMQQMLFQNALLDLYAGRISALDRDILSSSPLPENIVDPFSAQNVDALNTMKLTYEAMTVWVDEAKKAHYFTKKFVTLSRMIMNGTATMARGLMTLHDRGEDLSQSPMSIGDLISLSSYHFRKSYLGVIQTAKKHPEISERLLINQLGWCNTLMRLFKTKEKLSEKPAVTGNSGETALPAGSEQTNKTRTLSGAEDQGLSGMKSFAAPGAYAAPRAYGGYREKTAGILPAADALPEDAGTEAAAPELTEKDAETSETPALSESSDEILKTAAERAEKEPEKPGESKPDYCFTPDEMMKLVRDREFTAAHPNMAADMLTALKQMCGPPG